MSSHRILVVFVLAGSISVGLLGSAAFAQMEAAPVAYPSTGDGTAPLNAATPEPGAAMAPYDSSVPPISPAADSVPNVPNDSSPLYTPYGSPEAMTTARSGDANVNVNAYAERSLTVGDECWEWQILPSGLMYKTYLAGREPRIGSDIVHERKLGWLWNAAVGGRVGIVRFGTDNDLLPQGWQLDIEGAAFPRLDLQHNEDMVACDFRAGIPLTTRQGPWEAKFGYYHLSSHIGDEFLLKNLDFPRINYVRESLLLGMAVYLDPSLRLYSEVGWAFYTDGGAKPWEFQFGADFSSNEPTGPSGSPFFAINAHLRQENDFGGNMTVQTGWQWRGRTGHLFRIGMQYFNGMSDQYQFYQTFEEQIGMGVWYDF